jgi:O-antigen/teichoic acid export membrane protein
MVVGGSSAIHLPKRGQGGQPLQLMMDMIGRLSQKLAGRDAIKGSATALGIKFIAVTLNFAMFALLSRQMQPDAFGSFAIVFNALSFLASFALCGQEMLIVRSWGEYLSANRPELAHGALIFGVLAVSLAVLLTGVTLAIAWPRWDQISVPLVIAACAFLATQTLMHFNGEFSRVAAGVLVGDGPRQIVWRGIVVIVITAYYVMGLSFSATDFFFVAAVGLLAGMTVQVRRVSPLIPEAVKRAKPRFDLGSWVPCSFKMWLSALLDSTGPYLEVVVIGIFLNPTVAGFYFIATRITNLITMISDANGMYATTLISLLFYSGNKARLQDILRSLAFASAAFVAGSFLAIVIAGKLVLWAFGSVYISAYPALIILAVGAAFAALGGPAGAVLVLTGREGVYPAIMSTGLALRFLLIAALGPTYGLMGAAVAWSASSVAITLTLVIACRRLVGLDPSQAAVLARWRATMSYTGGS